MCLLAASRATTGRVRYGPVEGVIRLASREVGISARGDLQGEQTDPPSGRPIFYMYYSSIVYRVFFCSSHRNRHGWMGQWRNRSTS